MTASAITDKKDQNSLDVLRPSVVFVSENTQDLQLTRNIFRKERLHLFFYSSLGQALEQVKKNTIDLVVAEPHERYEDYLRFFADVASLRSETRRVCIGTSEKEPIILDAIASGTINTYLARPVSEAVYRKSVLDVVMMEHKERLMNFRTKLSSFKSLPAPERFQSRLQQLLIKKDKSMSELVEEIEKNPALVAKVLQVANSVQYWTRAVIANVWDSVVFIGTENIAGLVAAIEVFENIGKNSVPEVRAYYELIWERSLRRANIAKIIAEEWKEAGKPHTAYVAALLQDVGLLIRLSNEPKRYMEMARIARTKNISPCEAELSVFSNAHAEVGALVLQMWNFPKEIVFAIAHHHGQCYDDPLTQILQIADILYTSDRSTPHDEFVDPFVEIWSARLETQLTSQLASENEHRG